MDIDFRSNGGIKTEHFPIFDSDKCFTDIPVVILSRVFSEIVIQGWYAAIKMFQIQMS